MDYTQIFRQQTMPRIAARQNTQNFDDTCLTWW